MDIKEALEPKIPFGYLGLCLSSWLGDLTKSFWFRFKHDNHKEQVLAFEEMVNLKLSILWNAENRGEDAESTKEAIRKYEEFLNTNPWFRR